MRVLYNKNKWLDVWFLPKYQRMRDKITETFKDIVFDEEPHKYYVNGKEITCVSNVTHIFKPPFNQLEKAEGCYQKYYDKEGHMYYHMTVDEILHFWDVNNKQSTTDGTNRHNFGESCFYYMTGQYDKIYPEFKDRLTEDGGFEARFPKEVAIVKFWEELPVCFIPILCENKVYREDLNYSGTFDILFFYDAELDGKTADKSGFCIFDYKTNKNLYNQFGGETLLPPFEDMPNMDLSLYKLQLALYELALRAIGMKIIDRRLIWLKPDETYEKIRLESMANIMEQYLIEHPIVLEN